MKTRFYWTKQELLQNSSRATSACSSVCVSAQTDFRRADIVVEKIATYPSNIGQKDKGGNKDGRYDQDEEPWRWHVIMDRSNQGPSYSESCKAYIYGGSSIYRA